MKWKKYVKNVLVFILTVLGIIAGVFLGIRFFRFFMPFVIGWLIALIANPLVRMLERRLKVARKHTSIFADYCGSGGYCRRDLSDRG